MGSCCWKTIKISRLMIHLILDPPSKPGNYHLSTITNLTEINHNSAINPSFSLMNSLLPSPSFRSNKANPSITNLYTLKHVVPPSPHSKGLHKSLRNPQSHNPPLHPRRKLHPHLRPLLNESTRPSLQRPIHNPHDLSPRNNDRIPRLHQRMC